MGDNQEIWPNYWKNYLDAFSYPLRANELLSKFVTNPAITGAYAEAWIKFMVKSMLRQFSISTGAIIKSTDQIGDLQSIPQCDIIVWDPSALPALFEQGDFALVPDISVRAIIEVKRSLNNSSKSINDFEEQLKKLQECIKKHDSIDQRFRENVLGVVVCHNKTLFKEQELHYNWVGQRPPSRAPAMTRLFDTKSKKVDDIGVMAFIYFLAHVGGHTQPLR